MTKHLKKLELIARIEYPSLALIVGKELGERQIPYLFRTDKDENVLTVQIVAQYFFDIPLNLENVERTMRLIKYFIMRPDCAVEEMPEIRRRRDYRLAKSWKEIACTGVAEQ